MSERHGGSTAFHAVVGVSLGVLIGAGPLPAASQTVGEARAVPEAGGAVNALLFGRAAAPPAVAASAPEREIVRTLNPLSALRPADLSSFKGRPLFAASRRPIPPPAPIAVAPVVAAQPQIQPPPDLRLIGIVEITDQSVAILRRPSGGPALSLRVGDAVDTWRLVSIGPERIVLKNGDREHAYALFSRKSAPSPATAATAPVTTGGGISSILMKP